MKYIPILFSTEMVQTNLDGRQTQTRREVKPQLIESNGRVTWKQKYRKEFKAVNIDISMINEPGIGLLEYAPYQVGDILWARESYFDEDSTPLTLDIDKYLYRASVAYPEQYKWKPSIHMPREACRLFLKITDVRAERLHDISEEDAEAEGVFRHVPVPGDGEPSFKNYMKSADRMPTYINARGSFYSLWVSIYGSESWNNNPWVWVISYEHTERPKDFLTIKK